MAVVVASGHVASSGRHVVDGMATEDPAEVAVGAAGPVRNSIAARLAVSNTDSNSFKTMVLVDRRAHSHPTVRVGLVW